MCAVTAQNHRHYNRHHTRSIPLPHPIFGMTSGTSNAPTCETLLIFTSRENTQVELDNLGKYPIRSARMDSYNHRSDNKE